MAGWEDVRRIALALPEATERTRRGGLAFWEVKGKGFVWERPLGGSDVRALEKLGREIPDGPLLGVRVEHLGAKEALLADNPAVFLTIPHFDGYNAVLVRLEEVDPGELEELIVEAWLFRAPKRLAAAYAAEHLGAAD